MRDRQADCPRPLESDFEPQPFELPLWQPPPLSGRIAPQPNEDDSESDARPRVVIIDLA